MILSYVKKLYTSIRLGLLVAFHGPPDKGVSLQARRAQLKVIMAVGTSPTGDLMVASSLSADRAKRLSNARWMIDLSPRRGGVLQHDQSFVRESLSFLVATSASGGSCFASTGCKQSRRSTKSACCLCGRLATNDVEDQWFTFGVFPAHAGMKRASNW